MFYSKSYRTSTAPLLLFVVVLMALSTKSTRAFTTTATTNTATLITRNTRSITIAFLAQDESQQESAESPMPEEMNNESTTTTAANGGMDILNSPQFLTRKRDVLLNDLQKLQEEIVLAKERFQTNKNEWGTQIEDLQKEYEMIQQRMNVQSNSNNDAATSQVVRAMLAVLDNFDRAFGQVTAQSDAEKAIEQEYKAVYHSILEIFQKLGVQEIPTVGTEFNYEIHQAVMQKPSTEYAEGIVCEELQKGFQINNTLIRAAMVAVAM